MALLLAGQQTLGTKDTLSTALHAAGTQFTLDSVHASCKTSYTWRAEPLFISVPSSDSNKWGKKSKENRRGDVNKIWVNDSQEMEKTKYKPSPTRAHPLVQNQDSRNRDTGVSEQRDMCAEEEGGLPGGAAKTRWSPRPSSHHIQPG